MKPFPNHLDLVGDDGFGVVLVEQKGRSRIEAGGELAHAVAAVNQHGLGGFEAGAGLWADVVGAGQGERLAIPEGGMVAGMIVE